MWWQISRSGVRLRSWSSQFTAKKGDLLGISTRKKNLPLVLASSSIVTFIHYHIVIQSRYLTHIRLYRLYILLWKRHSEWHTDLVHYGSITNQISSDAVSTVSLNKLYVNLMFRLSLVSLRSLMPFVLYVASLMISAFLLQRIWREFWTVVHLCNSCNDPCPGCCLDLSLHTLLW